MMVKDYDDDGMEITFKRWFGRQGSWSGKTRVVPKSMAHDIASKALFHFRRY